MQKFFFTQFYAQISFVCAILLYLCAPKTIKKDLDEKNFVD